MKKIETIEALEALYEPAVPGSLKKVARHITPLYRQWIAASKFCVLSTIGPEGTDASPRGDDGPVVLELDEKTLALPDWRGNNRMDSLRNIVRDGRTSLMFMVPGCNNVVRINGTAILTDDPAMTNRFEQAGKHPKTVILFSVDEIYFQCAKAILRSRLWTETDRPVVPTAGQFLKELDALFDGDSYDAGYAEYAKGRMW
ncbi:pyridoxamine 5'-phosphate oxidase family protein [Aestuariibius sp. HNIBRBA575]|uniref:pyridoxamine 5'-phosphate oxidase family protein n=1 Tax=Aestuariibius sp. HNIBRBA575 TaxID=3233343 RepID=UPI0034A29EBB